MSSEIVIEGVLQPDGTIQLVEKPPFSPGRVTVTLQPLQAEGAHEPRLADVIDEIRRDQQARGFLGRNADEIAAGLGEEELAYERRMQAARA